MPFKRATLKSDLEKKYVVKTIDPEQIPFRPAKNRDLIKIDIGWVGKKLIVKQMELANENQLGQTWHS